MDFKNSKGMYIGGFGGRKRKGGNDIIIISKIKEILKNELHAILEEDKKNVS